ncbi:putative phage tail protein [Clostridium butyricum]
MNDLININTLLSYMPDYYKNSKVIENLNNAEVEQINKLKEKIQNVFNQFFILTLDNELEHKEKEFGMKIDRNLSLEERRNRLLPKNRGQGTATLEMIKRVAESFADDVDIIEYNSNYSFLINLLSTKGFPYKLDCYMKQLIS